MYANKQFHYNLTEENVAKYAYTLEWHCIAKTPLLMGNKLDAVHKFADLQPSIYIDFMSIVILVQMYSVFN